MGGMTESSLDRRPLAAPAAGRYRIDPDRSAVSFATRHLFGLAPVHGTFALRDGIIDIARPLEASRVEARVAVSSFRTGNPARDAAVLSARLLEAAAYPTIAFTGTALTEEQALTEGDRQWRVRGDLEVRGVSRPLEAAIGAVSADGPVLTAAARLTVDRYAFGITGYRGLAARRLVVDLRLVAVKDPS
jgi:polyisoprenoid-binding protein YceI